MWQQQHFFLASKVQFFRKADISLFLPDWNLAKFIHFFAQKKEKNT